jgi:hypothetical protein
MFQGDNYSEIAYEAHGSNIFGPFLKYNMISTVLMFKPVNCLVLSKETIEKKLSLHLVQFQKMNNIFFAILCSSRQ